jgi:hypothetical protein
MNPRINFQLTSFLKNASLKRGVIFGSILVFALLAFEVFNFGSTSFALADVLGDLQFAGMRWATILAFAFCAIDFAGIARIITPEQGRDEPAEVYYLFGAWLLAAGFNAILTWWGVSIAIQNHSIQGGALFGQETMTKIAPIFVASMVWLIRVLLIGTFSIAGDRLFTLADAHNRQSTYRNEPTYNTPQNRTSNLPATNYPRPTPKPRPVQQVPTYVNRSEPTYHPIGMSAMSRDNNNNNRNNPSVRR